MTAVQPVHSASLKVHTAWFPNSTIPIAQTRVRRPPCTLDQMEVPQLHDLGAVQIDPVIGVCLTFHSQADNAIRGRVGIRAHQRCIDHAEHRRGRSDAECQRDHSRERESWTPNKLPQCVMKILKPRSASPAPRCAMAAIHNRMANEAPGSRFARIISDVRPTNRRVTHRVQISIGNSKGMTLEEARAAIIYGSGSTESSSTVATTEPVIDL
jgi:hypothetical protein